MSKNLSHILLIGVGLFSSTWVMAAVKEYDLTIAEQTVNITGKPVERITVNGKFVSPLLEFEEGSNLTFPFPCLCLAWYSVACSGN